MPFTADQLLDLAEKKQPVLSADALLDSVEQRGGRTAADDLLDSVDPSNVPRGTMAPPAPAPLPAMPQLPRNVANQPIYPPASTAREFIKGIPGALGDIYIPSKESALNTAAAAAYTGAGAVKGATLGYVDPTPLLEKTPLAQADISKPIAGGAGQLAGALAPIGLAFKGITKGAQATGLLKGVRPLLQRQAVSGTTGFAYGAAHKPEEEGIAPRLKNATDMAAMFIILTAIGEAAPPLTKWMKEKIMTKEVDIPVTKEDITGFYELGRKNVNPEIYDDILRMPKAEKHDLAKRALRGEKVTLTKRVPRFKGYGAKAVEPVAPVTKELPGPQPEAQIRPPVAETPPGRILRPSGSEGPPKSILRPSEQRAYDIYKRIIPDVETEITTISELYQKTAMPRAIADMGDVRVKVVTEPGAISDKKALGFYNSNNNTMYVKRGLTEEQFNLVIEHELVHAKDRTSGLPESELEARAESFRDSGVLEPSEPTGEIKPLKPLEAKPPAEIPPTEIEPEGIGVEPVEVPEEAIQFDPAEFEPEATFNQQEIAGQMAKDLGAGGVEPGGVIRGEGLFGPKSGEVVGRFGRVSTNPEWYKMMGGENKKQIINALDKLGRNEPLTKTQKDLVTEAFEMEARVEQREPEAIRFRDVAAEKETLGKVKRLFKTPLPESKVKGVVRRATGQEKVGPKIYTEREAVKQALKIKQRTSREAARYGRNLANEANRLIKHIRSADIDAITHSARVEIENLQQELKTARTVDKLRDLNDRIQSVKEQGKEELAVNKDLRKQTFEANKEVLLKTLQGGRMFKKPGAPKAITEPPKTRYGTVARLHGLRPSRWMDKMDGGQDFQGPFNKTFYDPVNRAYSNEVDMAKNSTVEGIEILKKNGITNKDLGKKMKVGDTEVTFDQAMHIYGGFNNPETRVAIAFGNKIGVNEQQQIIKKLPENYKKAALELVEEMNTHYPRLRLAVHEFTDGKEELGKVVGNYIPMKRLDVDYQSTDKELLNELAHRSGLKKAYAERGFTKGRVNVPAEFQTPIRLGLSETFFNHIGKREHFIASGNLVKDLQRMANDKEVVAGIRNKFGNEYVSELQDWVNRIGDPSIYRSHSSLEKVARVAREKAVVVNLGFNLLTMGKQVPSLALMLGEVGPGELLSGIKETVTNFDEINKFVEANDPQMASRNIERELEEIKRVNPGGPKSLIKNLSAQSLKGIVFFDKVATRAGWISKYRQMIKTGASHDEAVQEAQKSILRTQPASAPKDIARLYASNEFLNLFTQFTNQLNQMWNMATYDIPMRARQGKYKSSLLGGVGIALDMAMIFMLSKGRVPTKKEDFGEAAADTAISAIPLIGPMVNSWRKGFDGLPATFNVAKKALIDIPRHLYRSVHDGKEGAWLKVMDRAVYTLAFTYGVPYNQVRRTLGGLIEMAQGDTDDLRRLIFSEYQLKEKGAKKLKFPKLSSAKGKLDERTAMRILNEAGGDKQLARQIAKERNLEVTV